MQVLKNMDFRRQKPDWVEKLLAMLLPVALPRGQTADAKEPEVHPTEISTKTVLSSAISAFQLDLMGLVHKGWTLEDAVTEAAEANLGLTVEEISDQSKP